MVAAVTPPTPCRASDTLYLSRNPSLQGAGYCHHGSPPHTEQPQAQCSSPPTPCATGEERGSSSAKGMLQSWIPALGAVLPGCEMTAASLTSRNLFFLEGEWLCSPSWRSTAQTCTRSLDARAVSKELAVITLQGLFSKVE